MEPRAGLLLADATYLELLAENIEKHSPRALREVASHLRMHAEQSPNGGVKEQHE